MYREKMLMVRFSYDLMMNYVGYDDGVVIVIVVVIVIYLLLLSLILRCNRYEQQKNKHLRHVTKRNKTNILFS